MKTNTMMRVASVLLVAVLLSTCVISGTFAKYVTSDDATDSARVAKWGVTVVATGDEAFAEKYDNAADANGTKVVSYVVGEDVLAPGTNGTLGGIRITGQPEVMVNIEVTAELTLTGWSVTGDWDKDGQVEAEETDVFYCPIKFTIGNETILGTNYTDATTLQNAVAAKLTALSATNVAANTDLGTDRDVTITWEWEFDTNDDAKDTALGNLTAAGTEPTIEFECEAIVTQVN